MAPYMPKNSTWTGSPGGGGYWCWLNLSSKVGGYNAFVGVYGSGLSQTSIQVTFDSTIDMMEEPRHRAHSPYPGRGYRQQR